MDSVIQWFKNLNYSHILLSAAVIVCSIVVWRLVRIAFDRYAAKQSETRNVKGTAGTAMSVTYGVAKGLVIIGVVLIVLQINDINVNAMVAGLGIASAIVGLAFQDLLRDIIMGIHIVTDNFFEVGDVIEYGNIDGLVVSYNIRTTKLQDIATGNIMTVCNRNFTEIKKRSRLFLMNVPLSYEEDYRKVHRVLTRACERIEGVESVERCEYMGTQDFKDSAVFYRIHIYGPPERRWEIWRAARTILQEDLDAAGMRIPYQQIDVHTIPEQPSGR